MGRPKKKDESPAVRTRRAMNELLRAADAEEHLMASFSDEAVTFIRETADTIRRMKRGATVEEHPDQLHIPGLPAPDPAGTDNAVPVIAESTPEDE